MEAASGAAGGPRRETAAVSRAAPLAQFAAVIPHLPVAVLVLDAETRRVVLQNARVAEIWHRTVPAGLEDDDLSRWIAFHPDGRRYEVDEWPVVRTASAGEAVDSEELDILRGDGTRGVVSMSSTPVRDAAGRLVGAVATMLDVTEERSVERGRRFLAEVSAELVSSLSYGTTLQNVARLAVPELADWCAVDIFGESGRVDRVAVEHGPRTPDEVASRLAQRCPRDVDSSGGVARVLRTGEPELASVGGSSGLERLAADGEHLALFRQLGARSIMIVPMIARGKTIGALTFVSARQDRLYGERDLGLAQELAARAALAIDNARLYQETHAASRAKSDFLAVMSHELRTPLTAIIGYAELLELGIPEPVTDSQREQVERIEVSARHLQELIEEILAVASLEAGEAKLRHETISVAELLRRAEVIIRPLAMEKQLDLEVEGPSEDIEIETDPEKLLQVLLNLLSNAVKFTERGSIRMRTTVRGDQVEVVVGDTGIGVAPRDHDRIFEPFWQVDRPTTRRAGGTGLGLTISKRLVELLGGQIRVESEPGEGSLFTVTVPVRPAG